MNRRNHKRQASDEQPYVALTISRGLLRSMFGDKVADQMTEARMQEFANTLHDFYLSSPEEDWQWILSEAYNLDFEQ